MPTPSGHTSAIRAKTAIGSDVKSPSGDKIGKVEDIVLDKMSNNIMFAVVGFDGVFGMGEKYHPIPWSMLDYEPSQKAYMCSVTKEQLKEAPAASIEALTSDDGQTFRDTTYQFYGAKRDWQ